jgi:hypothetical protein
MHAFPQPPQLPLSEPVFTHAMPASVGHCVSPGAQAHVPAVHTWPASQTLPHMPQFALSVLVFAQYGTPPSGVHSASPPPSSPPHSIAHLPAVHTSPTEHVLPHVPQLALSVCVLAQVPLGQTTIPGPQLGLHCPPEHAWPAGHALPQPPQLALSVWGFVHNPVPAGQAMVGEGHAGRHTPATQARPVEQTLPQPPQFDGSVARLEQIVPHWVCPVGQVWLAGVRPLLPLQAARVSARRTTGRTRAGLRIMSKTAFERGGAAAARSSSRSRRGASKSGR